MKDINAETLLSEVMNWNADEYTANVPSLQLLASYKYDKYQRFEPGKYFIESLSLWLNQFDRPHRSLALSLIKENLIFVSNEEMRHLVRMSYPDIILQERIRAVAEENDIPPFRVARALAHRRFTELKLKSLYLGLSDGALTNDLRRASSGAISNEQIWQAYELGDDKATSMSKALGEALGAQGFPTPAKPTFRVVWLVDDFSGSGNTYIRYDPDNKKFKGKIPKVYRQLVEAGLVDPEYYEIYLLLYVATRQAVDHIEYWSDRYTSEYGLKPLQMRVVTTVEKRVSLKDGKYDILLKNPRYFDSKVSDEHMLVGGSDGQTGFADCALPLVLEHNSPNNSVYLLWGPDQMNFFGLFPRVSRHIGA